MRYLKILITIVLFTSCEEYFRPDIDDTPPMYVFDGLITDQPGPYKVKIMKTFGYDGKIETITDAKVRIECSDGSTHRLTYDTTGCYLTDSATFVARVGKSYKLVAIFADGQHYESSKEEMLPCPDIDEVNGFYYETKEVITNGGEYFNNVESGICATNTTSAAGFTPYYRYECKIILQTNQHYPGIFPVERYIYRPLVPEGLLVIANANDYTDNKIVGNQIYNTSKKVMLHGIDTLVTDMPTYVILNYGEFVRVKQFSMNESQYKFWKAVKDQQENKNYFFGQIENQPVGNVFSSKGEKTLGYFCVSAVKQNFGALGLKESNKHVKKYNSDFFPDTDTMAYYELPQNYTILFDN